MELPGGFLLVFPDTTLADQKICREMSNYNNFSLSTKWKRKKQSIKDVKKKFFAFCTFVLMVHHYLKGTWKFWNKMKMSGNPAFVENEQQLFFGIPGQLLTE